MFYALGLPLRSVLFCLDRGVAPCGLETGNREKEAFLSSLFFNCAFSCLLKFYTQKFTAKEFQVESKQKLRFLSLVSSLLSILQKFSVSQCSYSSADAGKFHIRVKFRQIKTPTECYKAVDRGHLVVRFKFLLPPITLLRKAVSGLLRIIFALLLGGYGFRSERNADSFFGVVKLLSFGFAFHAVDTCCE